MPTNHKYRAFISYSHKDEKWASWLHKSLETYRVPKHLVGQDTPYGKVPEKLGKVFRDREELSSAHNLGNELTQALEDSACQIVICSPNAARSHWTNEEIKAYKRLGRENRIFCLIVGGEPYASHDPQTEDDECFPEAIRFRAGADGELTDRPSEPIAADARPHADGKQNALLKLISGLLGVGFDDLKQREQQRKHKRLLMITAAASVGMVMTTGLAGYALIQRNAAEEQRARAETEAETARQTTQFMVDLFKVSDPGQAKGNSITAREILDEGAKRVESELGDQPEIQATLMTTMGTVFTSLGLYDAAVPMVSKALVRRQDIYGPKHTQVAETLNHLGEVQTLKADYEDAEINLREALEVRRELLGSLSPEVGDSLADLADVLSRQGKFAEAEPMIEESLAIRLGSFGPVHPAVAESLEDLALNVFDQGDFERSLPVMRDAIERRRQIHSDAHPDFAEALNNLGFILGEMGEYEESETLFRESLAMKRVLFRGEPHPEVAMGLNNVAFALQDQGKLAEAEEMYREGMAIQIDVYGLEHPDVALSLNNLAFLLRDQGDVDSAIDMLENSLEMFRYTLGDEHPYVTTGMNNLGMWLLDEGNTEQAEPLLREALYLRRSVVGNDHVDVAHSLTLLADLAIASEEFDEAYVLAVEAKDIYTNTLGADHWRTASAMSAEGGAVAGQKDFQGAESILLSSFNILQNEPGSLPYTRNNTAARLVSLYTAWNKPEEARRFQSSVND